MSISLLHFDPFRVPRVRRRLFGRRGRSGKAPRWPPSRVRVRRTRRVQPMCPVVSIAGMPPPAGRSSMPRIGFVVEFEIAAFDEPLPYRTASGKTEEVDEFVSTGGAVGRDLEIERSSRHPAFDDEFRWRYGLTVASCRGRGLRRATQTLSSSQQRSVPPSAGNREIGFGQCELVDGPADDGVHCSGSTDFCMR